MNEEGVPMNEYTNESLTARELLNFLRQQDDEVLDRIVLLFHPTKTAFTRVSKRVRVHLGCIELQVDQYVRPEPAPGGGKPLGGR